MIDAPPIDEMVDGRGRLRPHWHGVMAAFSDLPESGLADRARRLDRAFEDEGVISLLPAADTRGRATVERAWRCDPVPLPLPGAEFAILAAGLAQRARLFEALLADLYGPQAMLAERLLPPALVFANPAFLRPCRSADTPPRQPLLTTYAADLQRGPDGIWRVLADRTSRAAGIGQAQENRRMLSRVLPEAFRGLQVRPLRPFFDTWQDSLQRLSRSSRASASVALLTPGSAHPQWFEHMLLSRELSCALVEAGDLTVRGGALYLKTLRGLQPIDVLLRRLDGRLIDPLEFGGSAAGGVPGLMDAAREGAVHIVNDPGTGAGEAPALAAFLPALCRRLLGEELALGSQPTVWLGDAAARMQVLADLKPWLIRPALDGVAPAIAAAALDLVQLAELGARIAARPWEFCATAALPASVAPCAEGDRLVPKPILLRLFLAYDGAEWQTLPGGLARVMNPGEGIAGRLPLQGLAKDVWVISEERANIVGPAARPAAPLPIRRSSIEMPSRVADNFFWLGRYVERLEGAARLIRASLERLERGLLLPREVAELQSLARCLVHAGFASAEELPSTGGTVQLERALLRSAREAGELSELFGNVAQLVESVRDRLTGDMYAAFTLPLRVARADVAAAGRSLEGLSHALATVLRYSAAVAGVAAENMVRGGGYLFLDLGRRIERAQSVTAQVAHALDQPPARIEGGLRLCLELCDSVITYRTRYLTVLQPAPVLDLVLADPGNPRGLAFQLHAMRARLAEIGEGADDPLALAVEQLTAGTESIPRGVLQAPDQASAAAALPPLLDELEAGIAALSDRITRRYFALLPAAQALGPMAETAPLRGAA